MKRDYHIPSASAYCKSINYGCIPNLLKEGCTQQWSAFKSAETCTICRGNQWQVEEYSVYSFWIVFAQLSFSLPKHVTVGMNPNSPVHIIDSSQKTEPFPSPAATWLESISDDMGTYHYIPLHPIVQRDEHTPAPEKNKKKLLIGKPSIP